MAGITPAERILVIVYSLLLASVFLSEWLFRSGNISERARGNVRFNLPGRALAR